MLLASEIIQERVKRAAPGFAKNMVWHNKPKIQQKRNKRREDCYFRENDQLIEVPDTGKIPVRREERSRQDSYKIQP